MLVKFIIIKKIIAYLFYFHLNDLLSITYLQLLLNFFTKLMTLMNFDFDFNLKVIY
jgi:hypothetical protein